MSPAGVLHIVPSDRINTSKFCEAHGLRHAYARNMMNLDENEARDETVGWVLLGMETWLRHEGHGVILAATGASWLLKNSVTICAGARLPPSALIIDHSSAKKLFIGVSCCQICPPHMRVRVHIFAFRGGEVPSKFSCASVWNRPV